MDELKEKLKEAGLDALEAQARLSLEQLKKIGKILVDSTETSMDNVAYSGLLMFEGELLKVIDKINGKVD